MRLKFKFKNHIQNSTMVCCQMVWTVTTVRLCDSITGKVTGNVELYTVRVQVMKPLQKRNKLAVISILNLPISFSVVVVFRRRRRFFLLLVQNCDENFVAYFSLLCCLPSHWTYYKVWNTANLTWLCEIQFSGKSR